MNPTWISTLLDEARTLAGHALRTGTLPPHSCIFELIDSTTQTLVRGEQPAHAPLVAEMQSVSRAAGISIEQLMQRETRLGRLSRRAALATPYLVGFMTLLLTLYLAFQSSELHKADLALREYQDLQGERLQEKIYQAWKLHHYERVLNVQGPALAQLDGYQQLVLDSKRLYEKRSAVQSLLLDSSVIRYLPDVFKYSALPQPAALDAVEADPATKEPKRPAATVEEAQSGAEQQRELMAVGPDCSKEPLARTASDTAAPYGSTAELDNFRRSIACFVQSIQIQGDHDYPMVSMIYETRNKVNLLVSWMLPGLYGLLGACVFLMRDLLRVNGLGTVGPDARIVDLLSLLLRVSLGGLAGIIIGWFWVPTAGTPNSSAIAVSSISFGVAFLAGFSIDSLFALLDRLIKNFRSPDEDKPAGAVKSTEGKA
ncbi:MAG: hypothetical protein Q8K96_17035 [Rubrivivax sp.]|nr:hypothetical protein [Rubrivivax sp.]